MFTKLFARYQQRVRFLFLCVLISLSGCHSQNGSIIDFEHLPKTVELFSENIVSTVLYERDMAITPDGDEVVFTVGDLKQTRRCLVSMKLINNAWSEPEILNFSGQYQDIEPFFAENGNRLFFASDRPLHSSYPPKDYDIWYVDRSSNSWSSPVRLDDHINTSQDEFYPSISASGNLYFTATREDGIGTEDIFIAHWSNGVFGRPTVLDSAINTPFYEFNSFIHPEENLIIFSSYGRPDGQGGGDLYYSTKDENGQWLPSQNMGPKINSSSLDYCPFVDIERGNFYFTSERKKIADGLINNYEEIQDISLQPMNGFGNIYRIDFKELGIQ